MTSTRPDLAALIGSRICHDLISPIGAISNGVELMEMTQTDMGPEFELISESVANANARVRLFRLAFGAADPSIEVGSAEIVTMLRDYTRPTRLEIRWNIEGKVPRPEAKLALLVLLCFENAMPWGGSIDVDLVDGKWSVTGTSERMKVDAPLWEVLAQPVNGHEIAPSEVQFLMIPEVLRATGRQMSTIFDETGITARF